MADAELLEQYILRHISEEEDYLFELDRETNLGVIHPRMLSGHLQGKILEMISNMIHPNRVLEIGTFTGYSAICLAKGLQNEGRLHTIEMNDELEQIARKYIVKAGLADKIIQHIGNALELLPAMEEVFDLVFIDGDKREYSDYYRLVFDKIALGGYIIADNILWNGKVLNKLHANDEQTKGIMEFNTLVKNDCRVEKVIFPVRDGMMVIRKLSN